MYVEGVLKQYLDDLAARKPAPGGGSAAALVGSVGAALIGMVANFTIGKEKYREVEEDMRRILSSSEKLRAGLEKLIDEDVTAYQKVSAAYKLPKDTEEQKNTRSSSIQIALKEALAVPLAVCRACFEAIKLCPALLEKGNPNLVSDVGVAAEFLHSGYQSGLLNVEINLAGIKDDNFVAGVREELAPAGAEIEKIREEVVEGTRERIK